MQDTFSDYQRDANEYYMLNKRVSEPICIILINDGDSGNSGYSMISIIYSIACCGCRGCLDP